MRIAFLVNDVAGEDPLYTTTRLAMTAAEAGHDVWYIGTGDLAYDPDEALRAHARRAEPSGGDLERFLGAVQDENAEPGRISVEDLDVLFLRNDPADDIGSRSWARSVGVVFGTLTAQRGVLVVNDPAGLAKALSKMYFHQFPSSIRPRTLVTREAEEVLSFLSAIAGGAVLKPLEGSGGRNVFFVEHDGETNVNQMIETIRRDGYIVVQEYVEAAKPGDVRLFMMDGEPLSKDGTYAVFRRARTTDDLRSNVRVGAEPEAVELTDEMLFIAKTVGPKLVEDGMFLVGLDIAGDKLLEVNVFSPAGLGSIEKVTGTDFTPTVIEALEKKIRADRDRPGDAA
ncbi:MAG TPA: glutathione synthase [Actinomycetota bacterium]|jgi:glutathione synthase|nr:glutathione synthase [Actinomycetota bacterium]